MGTALSAGSRGLRRELRHELLKVGVTTVDSHRFVHVLTQEFDHFGPLLHCQIHPRIGAAPIGAHRDEVAVLLISRVHLLETIRKIELFGRAPEDRARWSTWGNQAAKPEVAA